MSDQDSPLSIGQASERTGLPESTIRFYDREFSEFLSIQRGNNNQRQFTEENLKDLEYIRYLIKREDMSVEEVSERLEREQDFKNRDGDAENGDAGGSDDSPAATSPGGSGEDIQELKSEVDALKNTIREQQELLHALREDQENMLKLLDMNLQRYNKLVENLDHISE